MSFDSEGDRNELLNAFRTAIHDGTRGLIRGLSIELTGDDRIVVRGSSQRYYGVQLAIHTTYEFADADPLFPESRLLLNVDGEPLVLVIGSPSDRVERLQQSICVADVAPS